MNKWQKHINDSRDILLSLSVWDFQGKEMDADLAFKILKSKALGTLERRKTIYFIGNGRSASIANDASSILSMHTGMHTETFFDFSMLTSAANKSGFDDIFSSQLRKRMVPGDILFAISESGESPNIISAVKEALNIGANIYTFSAMNPGNMLRSLGTVNFYIPSDDPMNANLCHMEILNYWMDQMISIVSWQEDISKIYTPCSYEGKYAGN